MIMACSRAENNSRNPVPRVSWTIDEFCASVGISRSTYEKAKREGWGPRELVLGGTGIRITDKARGEWIASREEMAATVAAKRRQRHNDAVTGPTSS
jgi:hypothetical protein